MSKRSVSRRLFLGGISAATVVLGSQILSGCGQSTPPNESGTTPTESTSRAEPGVVNLYSSRHYNTDNELYAKFTAATGIKVNLIEGKADELLERIKSEGENSPADVFMTADVAILWRAAEAGVFQPIKSNVLETSVPSNLRQPEGLWFGLTKRARVIMYNKSKVQPGALSTYEALAEPQWKNRVIIRPSSNVYNQSLVASMVLADGESETLKWATGFVNNFARPPQGNDTAQIKDVSAGIADVTLANTYYLARLLESDDPANQAIAENIGIFFPNQEGRGAHVNISGAGVVKSAPNQDAAVEFLEYMVSEPAQTFLAANNYEYPVLAGVPLNTAVASFGEFKADEIDLTQLGPALTPAVKVMDEAGWK